MFVAVPFAIFYSLFSIHGALAPLLDQIGSRKNAKTPRGNENARTGLASLSTGFDPHLSTPTTFPQNKKPPPKSGS
jgi:hypothetical protein